MMSNLISAISYADIVFFVILGIALIGGLIGGLARAFKGFFKSIAVILISLLLVGVTLGALSNTEFAKSMSQSFEKKATSWGAAFNLPVYQADDGSYYVLVEYDGSENKVKIEDASGSGLVDQSKGKFAKWLAERFVKEDGQTLSHACGLMLSSIIISVIAFVVYCILLGLLCWVLRKIFKQMHESEGAVLYIDRILGAVVSVGLAMVFIMLVLAILHSMAKITPTIHEHLLESSVCGFFYEHNPISTVFKSIFG